MAKAHIFTPWYAEIWGMEPSPAGCGITEELDRCMIIEWEIASDAPRVVYVNGNRTVAVEDNITVIYSPVYDTADFQTVIWYGAWIYDDEMPPSEWLPKNWIVL
jgi:hypothetical protein